MEGGEPGEGGPLTELEMLGKSDRIVAHCLLRRGCGSQAALVAATGLSRPTVTAALTRLTGRGLAEMISGPHDDGHVMGRRAHCYSLTARAGHAVGVDIGRRHITTVIMDAGHRQVITLDSKVSADADQDPWPVLKQAADQVHVALEQAGDVSSVLGIGFGLPVPLTRDGLVGSGTLLPAWARIDPRRELAALLPGFAVRVGNEADLGALGEHSFGWGKEAGPRLREAGNRHRRRDGPGRSAAPRQRRTRDRIITEAASLIGTLANLSGPELVVLGGSLSAAEDLLTQPLRTALDQTAFAAATSSMSIKIARLGRRASACGATALVFDHVTAQRI